METKASHLLFSFNRWEKREEILKLLESGVHCIVDRYAFSGVVYSIANVNYFIYRNREQILNGVSILIKVYLALMLSFN